MNSLGSSKAGLGKVGDPEDAVSKSAGASGLTKGRSGRSPYLLVGAGIHPGLGA